MYSFQSFVFDFVWFPSAAQRLCEGFYAFTNHVLNTLRQHIWCSHFFSNVCTWKPHSGMKQCALSWRPLHILQPPGRSCSAKANPCSLTVWQLGPWLWGPPCRLPFEDISQFGVFFLETPHIYIRYQNLLSVFKPHSMTVFQIGWKWRTRYQALRTKDRNKLLPFQPLELEVTFYMCPGSRQHLIVSIHSLTRGVFLVEKRVRNRAFKTWVHGIGSAAWALKAIFAS